MVAQNFVTMKYPSRNSSDDKMMSFAGPAPDWNEETDYSFVGTQKDENQWNWWRHYFDVLTAED